jgi:predicted ribosome quality control (RQC) complex YloA/Tae2 family protein
VVWTEAKHVGKPRGAKPGSVTIKRERIIKVRPALPDA